MSTPADNGGVGAWQPFSWAGVARFATAPLARVIIAQAVVAALSAGAALLWLSQAVFPVVSGAVVQLPAGARWIAGRLEWPTGAHGMLGGSRHLSIAVDTPEFPASDTSADVQVVLALDRIRVRVIAWETVLAAPAALDGDFDRTAMEPRWDAWRPALLALAAIAWAGAMFVNWWILACVYALPLSLLAFFADRYARYAGMCRLAAAALLPAALLLSGAIAAYALGYLGLAGLAIVFVLHLPLGWISAFGAVPHLDRAVPLPPPTPFLPRAESKPKNPFAGRD